MLLLWLLFNAAEGMSWARRKTSSLYICFVFRFLLIFVSFASLYCIGRSTLAFLHWQCGRKTWKKISHKSTHTTVFDDFHRNSERIGWRETAEAWNHTKQMTLKHELTRTYTMSALVAFSVLVLVPITLSWVWCLCTCTVDVYICVRERCSGEWCRFAHTRTQHAQWELMRQTEYQRRR